MNTNFKLDKKLVGTLRDADVKMAATYAYSLNLTPAESDKKMGKPQIMLVLVDPQDGFIRRGRPLCVEGAIDDTIRTVEWILKNMARITTIAASLDSHLPIQIFFPSWWIDVKTGKHIDDSTVVTLADLKNKKYRAMFDFMFEYEKGKKMLWSEYYVTMLEEFGKSIVADEDFTKKNLMAWAFHCGLGTHEHPIESTLYEAIYAHALARSSQPKLKVKGKVELTEHFSIVEGEVEVPSDPDSGVDEDFLNDLANYDLIYIAGQAKSHCVLETIYSIVRFYKGDARNVLSRIRILEDCMSSVVIPGVVDFTDAADAAFAELSSKFGLRLVKSTDPIG